MIRETEKYFGQKLQGRLYRQHIFGCVRTETSCSLLKRQKSTQREQNIMVTRSFFELKAINLGPILVYLRSWSDKEVPQR